MKKIKQAITLLSLSLILLSGCSSDTGTEVSITTWEVPDAFTQERSDCAGEIVECSYVAHDYVLDSGNTEDKYCNVYLPYGYSEENNYNVLYLLHGSDSQGTDHQNTWFKTIGFKNVLDNMIYYEAIEPLIVVAPTFYSYELYGDDEMTSVTDSTPTKTNSSNNFGQELRNDIIPVIESTYSTYAESTSEEDIIASRDHRAMAGLSNGCRITLRGGITENFDYISWFGCFSSSIDSEEILEATNDSPYELNYMFNADGIYDFAHNGHKKMVNELIDADSKFTEENTEYVNISFGYHSARSWRVGLYNALQRFFTL